MVSEINNVVFYILVRQFEDVRPQEPQAPQDARGEEEEQPPLQEGAGQREEEEEGTDRGTQEPREEAGETELPADEIQNYVMPISVNSKQLLSPIQCVA